MALAEIVNLVGLGLLTALAFQGFNLAFSGLWLSGNAVIDDIDVICVDEWHNSVSASATVSLVPLNA
jgi:hypothetical protein